MYSTPFSFKHSIQIGPFDVQLMEHKSNLIGYGYYCLGGGHLGHSSP